MSEPTDQGEVEKCDVCGAPATSAAVDVVKWPNYVSGWIESKPVGRIKLGCDQHPAKSCTLELESEPL